MASTSNSTSLKGPTQQTASASSTQRSVPVSVRNQSTRRQPARAMAYFILTLGTGSLGTTPGGTSAFADRPASALLCPNSIRLHHPATNQVAALICCQTDWRQECSHNHRNNLHKPWIFPFYLNWDSLWVRFSALMPTYNTPKSNSGCVESCSTEICTKPFHFDS